ncbi:MAG: CDP-diacylglycerol--glycerol-3-phosphate 3-phosphatidyltransferase [Clostridia bacterium]|nr:CDP-diacylglycerol--glycerol-3-phosphate 3-phosphatidyltransferase [Clostridia bacterium]
MNTPNKITVLRIFLVPVFLLAFMLNIPFRFFISVAIFAVACITDAIDGKLARKNNLVTVFGQFLDPIADKMLVTAALLGFLSEKMCNIWIVLVILAREFIISSLRLIASAQGKVIPANIFGKIKTVMQMVSFIVVMLLYGLNEIVPLPFNLAIVSNILLGASAVMGIVSAVIYYMESRNVIDFTK